MCLSLLTLPFILCFPFFFFSSFKNAAANQRAQNDRNERKSSGFEREKEGCKEGEEVDEQREGRRYRGHKKK